MLRPTKFPDLGFIWSPPEALEQATSAAVAKHKAVRFRRALENLPAPSRIYDLCSGIGGDTLALADIAPVTAVDLSAVRTACLAFNRDERTTPPTFPVDIRTADIRGLLPSLPPNALVHIDPARRSAGKRSPHYEDLIPGPDLLSTLSKHAAGMALKLSPAVDFDSLPPGHLELISENGSVVQALLWTGSLAFAPSNQRTATIVGPKIWSITDTPATPDEVALPFPEDTWAPTTPAWLYELDGTLTRSSLAAPFCQQHHLTPITTDGGYAFSLQGPSPLQHPALTPFKIVGVFRYSERRITSQLESISSGTTPVPVEVKTRGRLPSVDTDRLQSAWSKLSATPYTILIFPYRQEPFAIIATRVQSSEPPE